MCFIVTVMEHCKKMVAGYIFKEKVSLKVYCFDKDLSLS